MNLKLNEKLGELNNLKVEARVLERAIIEDLYELERKAYDGKTYREHLESLMGKRHVDGSITIKFFSYNIWAEYKVNDDITIKLTMSIYKNNSYRDIEVKYDSSKRTLREVPKKYEKEYNELEEKCLNYQVERVTQKYIEDYGIQLH